MRLGLDNALGVARYLGAATGYAELPDDVVVVSPHLDDVVFSLGAAISRTTRRGYHVTVLTVLAGDPDSSAPAGAWDSSAGFKTAGEAARIRREEDRRACELLGAGSEWLPFGDHQYTRGAPEQEVRDAVVAVVDGRPVLLPGFPLLHEDHHWLHGMLAAAFPDAGLYTEQPYGAAHTDRPGVSQEPTARNAPGPHAWRFLRAGLRDRRRKISACRAYSSQLPLLEPHFVRDIVKYEVRVGGESIVPPTR